MQPIDLHWNESVRSMIMFTDDVEVQATTQLQLQNCSSPRRAKTPATEVLCTVQNGQWYRSQVQIGFAIHAGR